jgi:hypothetical protein
MFLKLQEAALSKQSDKDTKETTNHPQVNKGTMEFLKDKTSQARDAMTMEDTFHLRGTSRQ